MSSRMPRVQGPNASIISQSTIDSNADQRLIVLQRKMFTQAIKLQETIQNRTMSRDAIPTVGADLDLAETLMHQIAQVLG